MYDYGYGYDYESTVNTGGILARLGIFWIFSMALAIFAIVCMWKIYKKAGKPGWASLVPIYNIIVLLEIVELPLWYIALFFVPFANIYAMFKIYIELAHKFGKSTGFGVAMIFFSIICMPILAFGNAQYVGGLNNVVNNNVSVQTNTSYQQPVTNTTVNMTTTDVNQVNVNPVSPVNEPVLNSELNVQQPTMNTLKTCPNCGSQINFDAAFCTNCGHNMQ